MARNYGPHVILLKYKRKHFYRLMEIVGFEKFLVTAVFIFPL